MSNGQLKLVVIISADSDADRLMKALIGRGYPATKISSTGGFLHRGNATILSGVESNEVDEVFALVRAECHARQSTCRCRRCRSSARAPRSRSRWKCA